MIIQNKIFKSIIVKLYASTLLIKIQKKFMFF